MSRLADGIENLQFGMVNPTRKVIDPNLTRKLIHLKNLFNQSHRNIQINISEKSKYIENAGDPKEVRMYRTSHLARTGGKIYEWRMEIPVDFCCCYVHCLLNIRILRVGLSV